MPGVMTHVAAVQKMRLASDKEATRKKATTPTRFTEDRQPRRGFYLALPRTSSESRRYIAIGFCPPILLRPMTYRLLPKQRLTFSAL